MTLELAWLEYQREHPQDALQYSQFCVHYHRWRRRLDVALRQPHPYEPYLHPSYLEMAQYYDTVIVPAGVQLVERWVLAVLRKQQFFSLAELNVTIADCVAWLNARPFQKWEGSRTTLKADEPLKPLPAHPFESSAWTQARVHPDYHVQVDARYYSVPYYLVGETVEVRTTAHIVEIFHQGDRVASHPRAARRGQAVTAPEHRPRHHRDRLEWTPERFQQWAGKIGPQTETLITTILHRMKHPEQAYRTCFGILRLAQAVARQLFTYRSVAAFWLNSRRHPLPGLPP